MRVFVYEYACAQPPDTPLPESVRVEGRAMLTALVEDFSRIPGVIVETLRACPPEIEGAAFELLSKRSRWTVLIAPESKGLLLERCGWMQERIGRLLGPKLRAIALTGDKWETALFLDQHRVPTPRTWLAGATEVRGRPVVPNSSLVIAKPRWGAGSQDTLLAHRDAIIPSPGFIVQEYAPGVAASVAFLAGRVPGNATKPTLVPLRPTLQKLSTDGRFRYLGGSLPLPAPLADRAVRLASQAIECLPPLCGCLGVDLVLGDVPDGSQDYVIEINPRFTTSYIGLRALAVDNLAEAMLRIVEGKEIPAIRWRAGRVDFDADGSVRRME